MDNLAGLAIKYNVTVTSSPSQTQKLHQQDHHAGLKNNLRAFPAYASSISCHSNDTTKLLAEAHIVRQNPKDVGLSQDLREKGVQRIGSEWKIARRCSADWQITTMRPPADGRVRSGAPSQQSYHFQELQRLAATLRIDKIGRTCLGKKIGFTLTEKVTVLRTDLS